MYIVLTLLETNDTAETAITRLKAVGIPDPMVIRSRSVSAALSTEVPIFAGLRTLAAGADEDRLLLVSLWPNSDAAEVKRLITRVQLEMSADLPPSGRIVALPALAPSAG